jgi:hypothetical protein
LLCLVETCIKSGTYKAFKINEVERIAHFEAKIPQAMFPYSNPQNVGSLQGLEVESITVSAAQ